MIRKVSRVGPATLVVSLPSKWVKLNNIHKGDELELIEQGRNLLVSQEPKTSQLKARIDSRGNNKFLRRYINLLYTQSYNEIRIEFDDPSTINQIKAELEELVGMEIVDHGHDFCVLKNIAKPEEEDLEIVFRRIFLITLAMMEDNLDALIHHNLAKLERTIPLEKTCNKFVNFCERILDKRAPKENENRNSSYRVLNELEQLCDHLRDLSLFILKQDPSLSPASLAFFSSLGLQLREVYGLYYRFDNKRMIKVKEKRIALYNSLKKLFRTEDRKNMLAIAYMGSILDRLHHLEISMFQLG